MSQPNVLLICVDHWSGRYTGVAGHPCVMPPTADQLAGNGVRFTNAYSARRRAFRPAAADDYELPQKGMPARS